MLRVAPAVETFKTTAPRDTADGSPAELPVFVARPRQGGSADRPGVLVIQEIFGVNVHIQEVCTRLAGMGYVAVAPDLLHRSGHWQTFGYDQVQEAIAAFQTVSNQQLLGDVQAGLAYLAGLPGVDPDRIGVVGFCLGGTLSFAAAARSPERVRAAAIFYGGGIARPEPTPGQPQLVDEAGQIRCPVIAFFGAEDGHIPRASVERIEAALTAAGVDNTVYYYPGAGHGFFCDHRSSYHPLAAQDAWHRLMWFFGRHLEPVPPVTWQTT